MTNVDFENGVMTVNVELENRENFHEAIHNEVCGVFGKINNQWKKVLKANGITREKIEEMAKESIKELEKDCPDIWDRYLEKFSKRFHESCEQVAQATAELSKAMDEAQKELNQEQKYEPKDGDFVYVKAGYEHIAIFKEKVGEDMYVYVNWNMSFSVSKIIIDDSRPLCCIHDLREIRPTTEREKKILIDRLAKVNKKWNEEDKTIEDVRWRAEVGETFYYIDGDCMINSMNRNDFRYLWKRYDSLAEQLKDERMGIIEYMLWKKGNYFKTREAAEKVAEQIREVFKNSKAE